jgi:transposase
MESLMGIRRLYRKGNGQGSYYRSRMNIWSYYELQRQIEYKARWDGIPVIYVNPKRTSSTCAVCGSSISECAGRKVYCPGCKRTADRDENAALNVAKAGVRFTPLGRHLKRWQRNPRLVNPSSRCLSVDLSHDKLTEPAQAIIDIWTLGFEDRLIRFPHPMKEKKADLGPAK